jgi:uncharacterized membrane protein YccC
MAEPAPRPSWLEPARLRFCLRATASALLAFALTKFLPFPLHGLWAVLTAVVVSQVSVGGSLTATSDYLIGTVGGAVYACGIGLLFPHATPWTLAAVLALAVAPLAYAAALYPAFRVAPFTAVIVLMLASQFGETPIQSAFYRVLEVTVGGSVAIAVALLVFPQRAHRQGLEAASRALEQLSRAAPDLLEAFTRPPEGFDNQRLQDAIGRKIADFQRTAAEIHQERLINFAAEPDPAVLSRTLLRVRHDFVILGRAGGEALPGAIVERLGPTLARVGQTIRDWLGATAAALSSRDAPPPLDQTQEALAAYAADLAALRESGGTRPLAGADLERLFALSFAFQQLRLDLPDLARCIEEWAKPQGRRKV